MYVGAAGTSYKIYVLRYQKAKGRLWFESGVECEMACAGICTGPQDAVAAQRANIENFQSR